MKTTYKQRERKYKKETNQVVSDMKYQLKEVKEILEKETDRRITLEETNKMLKSKLMNDYFMIRRLKTEMEYSDDLMHVLREENNRIFGKVNELNSDVEKTDFLSKPLEILRKKFQEIEQVRSIFRNQI